MRHVDVVKNEWLAGFQVVVARAFVDSEGLHVDSQEPERWEAIVRRPFVDAATGERVGPEAAEAFLEGLHDHIRGDYLFATEAHDEERCPFERMVVPLQHAEPQREFQVA